MKYCCFVTCQLVSYLIIGYLTGLGILIPLIVSCVYLLMLNVLWSVTFMVLVLLKFKKIWNLPGNDSDEILHKLMINSSYLLFVLPGLLLIISSVTVVISNFENWILFTYATVAIAFSFIALKLVKKKIIYPIMWDSNTGNGLGT